MTKRDRVNKIINREPVDYLPSQLTLADRTRDAEVHKALGLPEDQTLDEYMDNHMVIALSKQDYPLFYRNDPETMSTLEAEGFAKVDADGKTVYDSWGMGIQIGSDGFFACFHPLQEQQTREFAEKWMPPRIWDAVTAPTLEERVKRWTPPPADQPGLMEWMKRDIDAFGKETFILPSGYFGVFERAYGMVSIETLFSMMIDSPALLGELFDKITDYKMQVSEQIVEMDVDALHFGDDLGTQTGLLFSPTIFREHLKPCYERLWNIPKSHGKHVVLHSCGSITRLLPDLVDIGLNVLEPVQPCNGLEYIKSEYGKDLTFWGGIDTQEILPFATPEQVKEEAKSVIHLLGKGGGHIIAPSQEIMDDVPLENVVALLETIMEERDKVQ